MDVPFKASSWYESVYAYRASGIGEATSQFDLTISWAPCLGQRINSTCDLFFMIGFVHIRQGPGRYKASLRRMRKVLNVMVLTSKARREHFSHLWDIFVGELAHAKELG